MDYDLELEKAAKFIKRNKAKVVCIQLPDGLKPRAREIQDFLEQNTKAQTVIWLGSCFGACDIPVELNHLKIDALIQWGHARYIV